MCLDRVYKTYKGTSRRIVTRYKLFTIDKGKIYPSTISIEEPLPEGVWLNEKDYRPSSWRSESSSDVILLKRTSYDSYPIGWHVYVDEIDGWDVLHRVSSATYKMTKEGNSWYSVYYVEKSSYDERRAVQEKYALYEIQCKGLLARGGVGYPIEAEVSVEVYKYIKIGRRLQWERFCGEDLSNAAMSFAIRNEPLD